MSASSRAARRAMVASPFAARAFVTRPWLALTAAHIARPRSSPAPITSILALLVPLRNISTEHQPVGPPGAGPPPGFSAEKAKIPLPKDESKSSVKKGTDSEAYPSKTAGQSDAANDRAITPSTTEPTVEPESLAELAAQSEADIAKKEEKQGKKLTLGQKIRHEIQHYWDGTKLLATEVRISTKLAVKMAAGYELTRRENRQLRRTVQDLARLVPFSVFIIVPFAEALLPIALKLFPNLLPSTYEGQKTKDKKAATLRATRKEVSIFLRGTLKETGLPLTPATTQKEAFSIFFRKLRSTGEKPTPEDVIKVCKVFRDDLTLDNLSRPQLVSMCRYMNLNTFGTDMMLRYQIRHRMRQIKRDDRAISFEGVDSLNVSELQTACQSRGIKTHGISPATLRDELQTWLDLRLKHGVPSTLLVLGNAFQYGQNNLEGGFPGQIEALTGVLSSIPEELYHEIELEVHSAEGAATNKQRLEVLKEQQELIEDEAEQNQENQKTGLATPRDVDDIDEREEAAVAAEAKSSKDAQENEAAANGSSLAKANPQEEPQSTDAKSSDK